VPSTELRLPRKCDLVVFYRDVKLHGTEVWETKMGPTVKHINELLPVDESLNK
jgi:hypothetical protein